jgi:GTP-binding protein HflX
MAKVYQVVLIDVIDPHTHRLDAEQNLDELKSLVTTYNGIDVVTIIQHRTRPDKATFIGSGKVEELTKIVKEQKIDIVVLDALVNPSVLFNLTKQLWSANPDIRVWDRIDLILHIFDKHAATAEAKLQIEIARMRHMGPRIYGLGGTYFSRQGGGIGGRGIGETNIELMKRHWRRQIKIKQDELTKLTSQRKRQLERRRSGQIPSIAIVGYTNAGKSSLFNLLTKRTKQVKDALFVTLDSTTGRLYLNDTFAAVPISDTIGFIKDLPSSLIDSFKSTLMQATEADILLHVIDVTDPKMHEKIEVVEKILWEIGARQRHQIYVFNKVDAHEGDGQAILNEVKNKYAIHTPHFISVHEVYGIDRLKDTLATILARENEDN